jgi:hypothetical protein
MRVFRLTEPDNFIMYSNLHPLFGAFGGLHHIYIKERDRVFSRWTP